MQEKKQEMEEMQKKLEEERRAEAEKANTISMLTQKQELLLRETDRLMTSLNFREL